MTLVCPDCFDDFGLKSKIAKLRRTLSTGKCCIHTKKKGIPVSYVAEIVDGVFRKMYILDEYSSGPDCYSESTLNVTLYELTGACDEKVANALADELIRTDNYSQSRGESPFYDNAHEYILNEFDDHGYAWREFKQEILHELRSFNIDAKKKLEQIFKGIHSLKDNQNSRVVYEIKSGHFIRARISNDANHKREISQNPAKELGPPPENLRRPGRMNQSGILAFYGAFDIDTCIAELRPAVSETIISVTFQTLQPFLVLDTTKFSHKSKDISIFAKSSIKRMRLWRFMSIFMNEIAKPCLPKDEHLDYIPTQVVAEYLHHLHKFKYNGHDRTVDAIIYQSAQNRNGKNIVIFGDAASVHEKPSQKTGLYIKANSVECHEVKSVSYTKLDCSIPKNQQPNELKNDYGLNFSED